jgi:DNA-binding transcriptional LysR family regulator
MLNLNDVQMFVKVVECSGFAPAARALGVPKSTLSKRVAELERALDVTLILRTTRRFAITPVGRDFHGEALAMVALAESAEQIVRGRRAEPTGPVRVTCSVPTAQGWLAALLPRVARRFPALRIALHATDRFVDVVRDGFDLAVRDHFEPLPDSSLVQRRVAVEDMVLVASPRYLAKRKRPKQPADLAGHDALPTRAGTATWTLQRADGESVEVTIQPRFTADETLVLLAAATEGLGIAALPALACRADLASGALRRVLPEWTAGRVTTTLLLADRRAQLPGVRAVADAIVQGRR